MADIRPPDLGAGRRVVAMGAVWAAACIGACAPVSAPPRPDDPAMARRDALPPRPAPHILTPAQTLLGARQATVGPTGMPRVGSAGTYLSFLHPSAVAVRGPEIYVVDSGRREILRLDTMQQALVIVPAVTPTPQTRLRVGGDGSLYVLDPASRSIQRFSRTGQRLGTFGDDLNLARPIDFVVDDAHGRVIVADATYQYLVSFHPAGRFSEVVVGAKGERGPLRTIAGMTMTSTGIVLSDLGCRCLVEYSPETGRTTDFGHDALAQPGALAADRHGRVYVLDAADRAIKVFLGHRLIASYGAATLGLIGPEGIAVDESSLYVADGAASRVAVFRIAPPGKGERP